MAITSTPEKTAFEGREVNAANLQRRIRGCQLLSPRADTETEQNVSVTRGHYFASARITSAAFSPMRYTAHTMKKPGMRGNTDASTTLRFLVW